MSILSEIISNDNKPAISNYKQIEYIPIDKIQKNENNKIYSIEDIDDMKQSIQMVGLKTPLIVKAVDDVFVLMSGHRRFTAIKELKEEGQYNEDSVMCIRYDANEIDLPLSEEDKDILVLLDTNKQRNKTDSDVANEIKFYKKIFKDLKSKGIKEYKFNEAAISLKGKTRDIVADTVGVSTSQVQKFNNVEDNGIDSLNDALSDGKIGISQANEIAKLDEDTQQELVDLLNEKGSLDTTDIKEKQHKFDANVDMVIPEGVEDKFRDDYSKYKFAEEIKIEKKAKELEDKEEKEETTEDIYTGNHSYEECEKIEEINEIFENIKQKISDTLKMICQRNMLTDHDTSILYKFIIDNFNSFFCVNTSIDIDENLSTNQKAIIYISNIYIKNIVNSWSMGIDEKEYKKIKNINDLIKNISIHLDLTEEEDAVLNLTSNLYKKARVYIKK